MGELDILIVERGITMNRNSVTNSNDKKAKILPVDPHYVAASPYGWGIEMSGTEAADGSSLDHAGIIGLPMTNFTIEGEGIKKARVRNKRGKWLDYKSGFGMNQLEALGDGTAITGLEIVGKGFIVGVHLRGGEWLNSVNTSDKEGAVTIGIGVPIDAIWIDRV